MISNHLEFVSIHQHNTTDINHQKNNENKRKTKEIKRKVQQEEYRQISGHATISIKIVRVCTMIVYGNF